MNFCVFFVYSCFNKFFWHYCRNGKSIGFFFGDQAFYVSSHNSRGTFILVFRQTGIRITGVLLKYECCIFLICRILYVVIYSALWANVVIYILITNACNNNNINVVSVVSRIRIYVVELPAFILMVPIRVSLTLPPDSISICLSLKK